MPARYANLDPRRAWETRRPAARLQVMSVGETVAMV